MKEVDEKRRKEAVKKALEHEKQFIKAEKDPDIIKKRIGSDIFKGKGGME